MKTLHIVRHGKSSWDFPEISDIDRPLIEKGILNNYLIAERIVNKFLKPDLIYTSAAIRCIHTAIIFARAIGVDLRNIQIKSNIYEAETSSIVDLIEETSSDINNLLIVGHNPTFTNLANLYLTDYIENLPTSGVVTLNFDTKNWNIIDKQPISTEIDFPQKRLIL